MFEISWTFSIFLLMWGCWCLYITPIMKRHLDQLEIDHASLTNQQTEEYRCFIRNDFNKYNKQHLIIGACIFLPFRIIGGIYVLICVTFLSYLASISFDKNMRMNQYLYNILFGLLRLHFRLMQLNWGYFWISTKQMTLKNQNTNSKRQYSEAPIIVSNHVTVADSLMLFYLFKCTYLADKQICKIPGLTTIGKGIQMVYFDRKAQSNDNTLEKISEKVGTFQNKKPQENMQDRPIVIFPEGTTTNGDYLVNFKKGAFFKMQPLKVLVLNYKYENQINPFIDANEIGTCLMMIGSSAWNNVDVKYYDYVTPEDFGITNLSEENWEEYAEHIRTLMSQTGNLTKYDSGIRKAFEISSIFQENKKKAKQNTKSKDQ